MLVWVCLVFWCCFGVGFFFTKTIGLKDRIKLRNLWNSKSCSAPELNYFDLERVVLLVTTEVLKIQTDTVY